MPGRSTIPFLLLAALLLLVGCGEDNPADNGETEELSETFVEDLSSDYSAALADPVEGMLHEWMALDLPGMRPLGKGGESGVRSVQDTLVHERGGIVFTRIRVFYDSAGNVSQNYDSSSTVAMDRTITIAGTHASPGSLRTATIDHAGQMYIEGIAPDDTIRTSEGSGTRVVSSEMTSPDSLFTASMASDYAWTVTGLQWHRNRPEHPWPLDGTVQVDAEMTRERSGPMGEGSMTRSVSFTVHFNGTRYAQLELEDGTLMEIDLLRGRPHRPGGPRFP